MALIQKCVCGKNGFRDFKRHHLMMRACNHCGILHQEVNMTTRDYYKFYSTEYHDQHQTKIGSTPYKERYDHDTGVAAQRFKKYRQFIPAEGKLLDIGSGNGAFVDYARSIGYQAYGTDFVDHKWTYKGSVEDIHFPTEFFDVITIHDVLEHLIDPVKTLKEVRRILKPGGRLIVDFPNYFAEAGRHHWRPIQHLWYFTEDQLVQLLQQTGFETTEVDFPIQSKFVVYGYNSKSAASDTKILVLPGMGDIYWTMTKFQSFLAQKRITLPKTYIWNFDQRPRSKEFLQKFPFLKSVGYWNAPVDAAVLNDTYITNRKWVVEKYEGFDYYLSVNGLLVSGDTLDKTQGVDTDWYVPMFEPIEGRNFAEAFRAEHGDYVVAFFSDMGMFERWVKQVPVEEIYDLLSKVADTTGCKVLLTGCEWDRPLNQKLLEMDTRGQFMDMIAKTTNDEFLAMMRLSRGMIGWCGGNTVMSTVFKKPTIMFWCQEHFKEDKFFSNCCPPDSLERWYFPRTTEQYNPFEVLKLVRKHFV